VISGNSNRILKLELEAKDRGITVNEIIAKRTGTGRDADIVRIRMEDVNQNSIATGSLNNGEVTFRPEIKLNEGQSQTLYIVVDISNIAEIEKSLGFRIENNHDVDTDYGTVFIKNIKSDDGFYDRSYVLNVPDDIKIDGAFSDWKEKLVYNDTSKDAKRKDLDILNYGVSNTDSGPAFYLRVDDEMCGGVAVPYWNNEAKREPITPTEPIGEPPGPPPFWPKTGEDIVYILIDTDSTSGYLSKMPIRPDYMIEIKGKNNKVLNRTFYEWSGSWPGQWNWSELGFADVALDTVRMEVALKWDDIGIDPDSQGFEAYFYTTDWEQRETDYSDLEGPIRGTRAVTLAEIATGIGSADNDGFGWNVSYAGDVNNDGYPDIIVGAPFNETADRANPDWWNTEWSHRKKLVFDNSAQTEDLENFPVMVNLSSSNFDYSNAKSDGTDLRFIDPDGSTEMNYHIEEWDTSASSYVWVNVTSIDGASSTDYMYMYYGNSSASDVQDITGTYDTNFSGVWHLNESSGTLYDATSNDLDGTQTGGVTYSSAGQIDDAVYFDGDDDEIYISDDVVLDPPNDMTIEAWVKITNLSSVRGSTQNIVYREHSEGPWLSYELAIDTSDDFYMTWVNSGGTENYAGYSGTVNADTWYYIVGVRDGNTLRFYLNGGTTGCYLDITTTGTLQNADSEFHLGDDDGPDPLNGTLDEVRLSDKARSADWVAAQYLSMTDEFITYGEEDPIWWNTNWQYRRRITFNNSGQTETLNNFTTLVKLTTSNFGYTNFNSNGSDIRFIDPDGSTGYNYHYEEWNTSGDSYIWVNVTDIIEFLGCVAPE
jgi:hypothetical protein